MEPIEKSVLPAEDTDTFTENTSTAAKSAATQKNRHRGRKWLIAVGILAGLVVLCGGLLNGRIATMRHLNRIGDGVYTLRYRQNYHLDRALAADISNDNELMDFVVKEFFFGLPVMQKNDEMYACSAFITDSPDGQKLVGRNFDFIDTDAVSVYTEPKDGYASISTVCAGVINIGEPAGIPVTSLTGRAAMLAAPYLCVDGVNEKGLSVTILDLGKGSTAQKTDAPDLHLTVAVRLLLDRAATVDEAVNLLRQYDICCGHGYSQHLFIADSSGRSVVTEWVAEFPKGFLLHVIETPVCTNFTMTNVADPAEYPAQCSRFATITDRLHERPVNDVTQTLEVLEAASVKWTQWSLVYGTGDFSVDLTVQRDFQTVYHLTPASY